MVLFGHSIKASAFVERDRNVHYFNTNLFNSIELTVCTWRRENDLNERDSERAGIFVANYFQRCSL